MPSLMTIPDIPMKYERWYNCLMARAARRKLYCVYVERHHVLPKALGGGESDIVVLTYREHFLAHWLLTKFVEGERAQRLMNFALHKMISVTSGQGRIVAAFIAGVGRAYCQGQG